MNKFKFPVVLITLLAFLAVRIPIAYAVENDTPPSDDELGDYESMEKGEKAPYDGLLFTNEAIIKIITNKHLELDKLKLDKDIEIKKIQLDLDILKKQHDLETKITKDLNDNLLKLKQDRIDSLEGSKKWDDIKILGALTLGIVLSVTVFYAAVQISK
jgi:hypothetical protein